MKTTIATRNTTISTLTTVAAILILSTVAAMAGPAAATGGTVIGTVIPDADPAGVTLGPLAVGAEAAAIHDVIVGLEIAHAYAGDLSLTLHYDGDNDGAFDASAAIDLHLARVGASDAEELYAIPVELAGTYYFKDEGWEAAGEDVSLAKAFDGQPSGGSFYLTVVDDGEGYVGTLKSWMVTAEGMDEERLGDVTPISLASVATRM